MTVATDIAALKARCTSIEKRITGAEAKNAAQTTSILALRDRCTALEAQPPFDPGTLAAAVDALSGRTMGLEAQVAELLLLVP